jgi:tRNA threonylcarbamoyladenosine biosynthesis protein TsaB
VAGAGPGLYPEAFPHAIGPERPSAGWLAHVVTGELAELLDPEPLYLRRPDAVAGAPSKPVTPLGIPTSTSGNLS